MNSDADLIAQAYSMELFRDASQIWQTLLSEHLQTLSDGRGPVLNWQDPRQAISAAGAFLSAADHRGSADSSDATENSRRRFSEIVSRMLRSGQNLHHPRYLGHQVPASVPLAGLFDAVSSVTNQVMAIYEMGPWATAVEHAIINALSEKAGWEANSSTGLLTHGGSLANLTALLTARNVALPDSWESGVTSDCVLVTHPDSHYCVTRSAGILGLGSRQVVRCAADRDGHMDTVALDEVLRTLHRQGRTVIAVSACACAIPTGAFDDLIRIAEICRHHRVWLHVDAAHGGGLLMSRRHRSRLQGIELADSLIWDAHKMLFVPALCAAVLYRNRDHRFRTFQQDAPYLFDPSSPGMADIDSGMRTIECTKRAVGFGLWGIWAMFGEALFEQIVDRSIQLTEILHEKISAAADFEALHRPECNILAFRYLPDRLKGLPAHEQDQFQRQLRTQLIRSGMFYIVQTTLHGRAALRTCLMNPATTVNDLDALLDAVREVGSTLM